MSERTKIETDMPISNEEMEKDIIGHLMQCSFQQVQQVRETITTADMFYYKNSRNIFRVICYLNDQGQEVTSYQVSIQISKRNLMQPHEFAPFVKCGFVSYIDLLEHIRILKDYYDRRKLYQMGDILHKAGISVGADVPDIVDSISNQLNELINGGAINEEKDGSSILNNLVSIVNNNLNGKGALCTKTGFRHLDKRGGFQETDLIIVAGATSMGKTSFVNSIVGNMMEMGYKTAFYTREMTSEQILSRILAPHLKLHGNRILNEPLTKEELKIFDKNVGDAWEISKNVFIDEHSTTLNQIIMSVRKLHYKFGIRGIFVDYLQLIEGQDYRQSKQEFTAEIARKFKNLAKELKIWVVLLSQMNRDKATDKENPIPTLDRLRDSGQIADAADDVMFVYRPDYYNSKYGTNFSYPMPFINVSTKNTALILIEKGRNRGTDSFICGFDGGLTNFYDLDTVPLKNEEPKVVSKTDNALPF